MMHVYLGLLYKPVFDPHNPEIKLKIQLEKEKHYLTRMNLFQANCYNLTSGPTQYYY